MIGIIIPQTATKKLGRNNLTNIFRSLSKPAKNINRITPKSEKTFIMSFVCTMFNTAGPTIIPARSSPMTAGKFNLLLNWPPISVASKMINKVSKNCILNLLST